MTLETGDSSEIEDESWMSGGPWKDVNWQSFFAKMPKREREERLTKVVGKYNNYQAGLNEIGYAKAWLETQERYDDAQNDKIVVWYAMAIIASMYHWYRAQNN